MLHLLDESLEAYLRKVVPLPARDIDIIFDAPDGTWAAAVSRPTVNLYLWDVRHNLAERHYGDEIVNRPDGRKYRRDPLPRIDCRYLVTAWTSEVRDEHALLGHVLTAILLHPLIGVEHLLPPLDTIDPQPTVRLRSGDGSQTSDLWSALGGQLKPGLDLLVTATLDPNALREVGPPVEEVLARVRENSAAADEPAAAPPPDLPTIVPPTGSPAGPSTDPGANGRKRGRRS